MNIDCGGWIDGGLTRFVLILYEMSAGDLCLSFFGMFARRSKSHSWPAVIALPQLRGATMFDDGSSSHVGDLVEQYFSFSWIAIC
jgi:hypothetical protein